MGAGPSGLAVCRVPRASSFCHFPIATATPALVRDGLHICGSIRVAHATSLPAKYALRCTLLIEEGNLAALRLLLHAKHARPNDGIKLKFGERLIQQGEVSEGCYLIADGTVAIIARQPASSKEITVAERSRGKLVGETAILQPSSPRTASVEVVSETATFIKLTEEDLSTLLGQNLFIEDNQDALSELSLARQEETREVLSGRIRVSTHVMSVLMADIHNFTSLGEAVWEEQSSSFLFEFMEESELIADGIQASFNDQGDGYKVILQNQSHVLRSLEAAIRISAAFIRLRARWVAHNDAFSNIGLGIGICTDRMAIRRRLDPILSRARIHSHSINIAAAMSKFRSSVSEVGILLDENTARAAQKLPFHINGPSQQWLERLGRIYPIYKMQLPANAQVIVKRSRARRQVTQRKKRTILFLSSDPTDEVRLRLNAEAREIEERLRGSQFRDKLAFHQKGAARAQDVSQALLELRPDIVHFSGHGSASGEVCFEGPDGKVHRVAPRALAALFGEFKDTVQCVVLNACYSEKQAIAIAEHVDYVIGMKDAISDKAAIAFSIGLYQALGAGKAIPESYRLGCVQIGLQLPGSEDLIPLLRNRRS